MLRISHYLKELLEPKAFQPSRKLTGPVVIWNLIRRCNLTCKHCYSISADKDFPNELNTDEVLAVMADLKAFGVSVLILSGGEPLLRQDIFEISQAAKNMGFYVGLSTNGTLIDQTNIKQIAAMNYDYVGISLDGIKETHDYFRRKKGAFDASLNAVRLCHDQGIKVGVRFTLTQDNQRDFPLLLELIEHENIAKFYLSHLNYAGRGNKNRKTDVHHTMTRQAMDLLFDTGLRLLQEGKNHEFVTGNNDADGVFLLNWAQRRGFANSAIEHVRHQLEQWGGNSSGVNIANIDNLGIVHPDTFWWQYSLGSVRERLFSQIWTDISDPLMAGLKQSPRPLQGRCATCMHQRICGGNTRVRAWQTTGNFWAEDPGCYLTDEEI